MAEPSLEERVRLRAHLLDDEAIDWLQAPRALEPGPVHDVRLCVKRLRALWWLARPTVRGAERRAADAELRDAARALAELRDTRMLEKTLGKLRKTADAGKDLDACDTIQAALTAAAPVLEGPDPLAIIRRFEADRRRWSAWAVRDDKALLAGLQRTYRRGRRLANHLLENDDPETSHTWRKWVKYLLYQLEVFPRVGEVEVAVGNLQALGSQLGQRHDLVVLRRWLNAEATDIDAPKAVKRVLALIDERDALLRKRTRHLGEAVYHRRPKAFVRRIL